MGEHKTNETAQKAAAGEIDKKAKCSCEDEKVSPISGENLLIITELARIGLNYLKMAVPDMKANIDKGDSAITMEQYDHFKSLLVEGGDTVNHFDGMCQYLHDASQKLTAMQKELQDDAAACPYKVEPAE